MFFLVLCAMIGVPVLEIAVFIEIGGRIGLWPTIATVILTAVLGTALLRQQGLVALKSAQKSLEKGDFPVREVFDGLCLLVAGALLLTPGFVTDGMGFLLFLPPVRVLIGAWAWNYLIRHGRIDIHAGAGGWAEPEKGGDGAGPVIDGEFDVVDESDGGGAGEKKEAAKRLPPEGPGRDA